MRPFIICDLLCGVRRVYQRVIVQRPLIVLNLSDFQSDCNQCITEPVKFPLRLAFGWLDHHGPRNGPGHCRCVESVVHQSFGDILNIDSGKHLPLSEVYNEFMGNESIFAPVNDWKLRLQSLSHVVGVEDRNLSGLGESAASHHPNVRPGYW
mgnify:CR=1 FL=1